MLGWTWAGALLPGAGCATGLMACGLRLEEGKCGRCAGRACVLRPGPGRRARDGVGRVRGRPEGRRPAAAVGSASRGAVGWGWQHKGVDRGDALTVCDRALGHSRLGGGCPLKDVVGPWLVRGERWNRSMGVPRLGAASTGFTRRLGTC